jgi:hypothetical protein
VSLKNVDIECALRRIADRRIEEAMREGKFDNLPGAGKPLNLEPMPAEENARMTWWLGTNAINLAATPVNLEAERERIPAPDNRDDHP